MTQPRVQTFALIAAALAGLAGGCGVILAAIGAHGGAQVGGQVGGQVGAPAGQTPLLAMAANFLLIHAAATLALAALALAVPRRGGFFLAGAALFLVGSALFCGDLANRALAGASLFPMAAPLGGGLLILGWAAAAVAAFGTLAASSDISRREKNTEHVHNMNKS